MRSIRLAFALCLPAASCSWLTDPGKVESTGRLAVGEQTVCALDDGGAVYCWGASTEFWEYGAGPAEQGTSTSPVKVRVPPLAGLGLGGAPHTCGLTDDDLAVCWGRGTFGQLGGGDPGDTGNPATAVASTVRWSSLAHGRLGTCGLDVPGKAWCWGFNQNGEIGDDSVPIGARVVVPNPVAGDIRFTQLSAGWMHACGIATSGALYCWGSNGAGQLGTGSGIRSLVPVAVSPSIAFSQVSTGSLSTCAVAVDGRAFCWGRNSTGQLGDGTTADRSIPTPVAGGLRFRFIAVSTGFAGGTSAALPSNLQGSNGHACGVVVDGDTYCWGWNGAGQLGDQSTVSRLEPVRVETNHKFTVLGAGGSSTCGMRGRTVWCWGSNAAGQLGNGTMLDSPAPVRVLAPFDGR